MKHWKHWTAPYDRATGALVLAILNSSRLPDGVVQVLCRPILSLNAWMFRLRRKSVVISAVKRHPEMWSELPPEIWAHLPPEQRPPAASKKPTP